jgi:hypothetical protein
MGISVAEYFAQKEACEHCSEHGNEEHCVTTLLSRAENCFFYNAVHMNVGDYTEEERALARSFRDQLTEEALVDYYFRGEIIIEKMKLFDRPFYETYDMVCKINHVYLKPIMTELKRENITEVLKLTELMLSSIEKEYP